MAVPEYRVRLFLSVDLTGSTAYKQKNQDVLLWLKSFQIFYKEFPRSLIINYKKFCQEKRGLHQIEKESGHPLLWKTIGDEILFCCRIHSLCHLGVCIDAFVETLKEYGATIAGSDLNTKGNAWVASFPTPNCSILPKKILLQSDYDQQTDKTYSFPTEADELLADQDPSQFDFLGKGIDAGFRISKNSAIDSFTISPGLGILLCQATRMDRLTGCRSRVRLADMQVFKGVAYNNPYPVITIDTCRKDGHEDLLNRERLLLGKPKTQDAALLEEYLKKYLMNFEIEIPYVKNTFSDLDFSYPPFYSQYCATWQEATRNIEQTDRNIAEAIQTNSDGTTEQDNNTDLQTTSEESPAQTTLTAAMAELYNDLRKRYET